jgi:hypothetical protein
MRIADGHGHHHIGRRGAILLILSVIDVAYGLSLVAPSAESVTSSSMVWRQHYAPTWVWGSCWLIVGAVLVVSAFLRNDAFGYAAAIGWKIIWALTTLASWAFGGVDRGWVATIIWGVFGAMIWVISGWPEPSPIDEGG